MLLRILKNGRAEFQCELFILVANISIDNVKMRDMLIYKGVIDAILQAFEQDLSKSHLHPILIKFR